MFKLFELSFIVRGVKIQVKQPSILQESIKKSQWKKNSRSMNGLEIQLKESWTRVGALSIWAGFSNDLEKTGALMSV